MKTFEIHLHTLYSECSSNQLQSILDTARSKGLSGIAITDHNTIKGALELKKLNKDRDFEVIIGEEVSTDIGHVLVYYVKKTIPPGDINQVLKEIKKQKAVSALAHPYNELSSKISEMFGIKHVRKSIREEDEMIVEKIDAVEGFNSKCFMKDNILAQKLAKKFNKTIIAGSDAHFLSEIGNATVEFEDRYTLKDAILKNKIKFSGKRNPLLNRFKSFLLSR